VPSLFKLIYTYAVVLVGWVFFRAETLAAASTYLGNMISFRKMDLANTLELPPEFYTFLIIGLVFAFITLWNFGKRLEGFFFTLQFSAKQFLSLAPLYLILLILSMSYIAASDFNPFIYFRF
jgi:alginate O-acetyltransferase complex protein AlgI